MPQALIVVPTYNERDNVREAAERLLGALPGAEVLVVDDNSPDGTGALLDELAAAEPRIHVMHRAGKLGLGTAYVEGFRWALDAGFDYVFEMDADFSHDPADLPRLLEAARRGDASIGSRWVTGGGTQNWSLLRTLISRGGSLYARTILGLPIRDLTGGFKCFHRRVLEALDLDAIRAGGYGFQIELTYRAIEAVFTVVEVPILFRERREGHSKMTARIALEAAVRVPALRIAALRGRLPPRATGL